MGVDESLTEGNLREVTLRIKSRSRLEISQFTGLKSHTLSGPPLHKNTFRDPRGGSYT